jgi:hypothetical protein
MTGGADLSASAERESGRASRLGRLLGRVAGRERGHTRADRSAGPDRGRKGNRPEFDFVFLFQNLNSDTICLFH